MDDIEIGAPLPRLETGGTDAGVAHASSLCLVRLHGRPLGLIELELPAGGLEAEALAGRIEAELGDEVARHLREDGLPPTGVDAAGVPAAAAPCEIAREERLSEAPTASVVICTRNRPDSVRDTLRSILACRYPAGRHEVIVVDNATEADESVKLVEAEFEGEIPVRVLREPEPGLSNARNRGLQGAEGEIVVFADDDVDVDHNWLATLVAPFDRGEKVGATSGMTLPGALETPTQRWIEGFGGRVRGFEPRVFDLDDPPVDRPLFPFTLGDLGAGRNMAFRRDLLTELGGFDPALGPGTLAHDGDDIEALLRVLLTGHAIFHDPAAIVWHAHPREYRELEQRVWGYGIGLTACLTRAISDHPGLLVDLARKLPRGVAYALSPKSEKNAGRQRDFPPSLVRRELLGMAYGPLAYMRSCRRLRRRRSTAKPRRALSSSPSSLRVMMVTDEYWPVIGGAGRSVELLARNVARRGHTVAVVTAWQPGAQSLETRDGVTVHRIRDLTSRMPWISEDLHRHHAPPFPDPEATWRLRRLIRAFEPDLIHAYGWLASSAAVSFPTGKIPFVVSAHDYGNACAVFTLVRKGRACSGPAPLKCLSCASSTYGATKGSVAVAGVFASRPLLRRKLTMMHGVSGFVSALMGRALHVPDGSIVTIPNFLESENGQPLAQEILDRLPTEPFIMFVGHLRAYKGIEELLEAYASLEQPPPLVLVGTKGPDTPARFPAGVTVFTYVPHATVMAMWERALFAVSPSLAPETGPIVAQEAMSKGRAVIGSRAAGYQDLIEDGETGLLVPPGDSPALAAAMTRLIEDRSLRERMGRRAQERARQFSAEAIVPRFERLYYDAISQFGETGER
jgi:glycosyltransferase involved in cell wall biosynthesis/GT2 family glycosyltransferase